MAHATRTRLLTAATGGTLIAVGYFPPESLGPGLSTGEVLDKVVPALLTCLLGVLFIAHALADGGTALLFGRRSRAPDFARHEREVDFLLERGKIEEALARCRVYLQQAKHDPRGFGLALRVAGEHLGSPRDLQRLMVECRRSKLSPAEKRRVHQQAQRLLEALKLPG